MAGAENPLLVFLSSVMDKQVEDLSAERQAAKDAINSLPLTRSWTFEDSPASADQLDESYLSRVDDCDIFLIVLGRELTGPVENEYTRAATLGKRRLLFVKNDAQRSSRAATWLNDRQDIKYQRFEAPEDLAEHVKAAVIDELIKAHRRLNLRDKDFEQLASKLRSEPVTFMVRTIDAGELREITASFPQLEQLYPDFQTWVDNKMVELNNGGARAYVAAYGQENAGFALVSDKLTGVRKLSTLYMKPRYQGLGVGPRLLFGVIDQAARDGIEKLYLTVSEERRETLENLLEQFGFFVEGVSGRRYRPGSWEWIWAKRLVHGRLRPQQLTAFVTTVLLEERGYFVKKIGSRLYQASHRYSGLGLPRKSFTGLIVGIGGRNPDKDFRTAYRVSQDMGEPLLFVSIEPVTGERPDATTICLDSLDLETMFFPMYVERDIEGLIIPIQETFVERLIPRSEQSQFLTPTRIQLRTDNVYYRYPTVHAGLKRGSPLFFYETQRRAGQSWLIGEAKLLQFAVDTPKELLGEFGHLGVYSLKDIDKATMRGGAQKGKALALRFGWYREIEKPLHLNQIRQVLPSFDPMTARRIGLLDILELRRLAGWNVAPLSLR
jgi:GNAT superfamily N-acetyltransferase